LKIKEMAALAARLIEARYHEHVVVRRALGRLMNALIEAREGAEPSTPTLVELSDWLDARILDCEDGLDEMWAAWEDCPECEGTYEVLCPRCDGLGEVEDDAGELIACATCDGTAIVGECDHCEAGQVFDDRLFAEVVGRMVELAEAILVHLEEDDRGSDD